MGRFRCEERLSAEGPLETFRARVQGLGGFDRLFRLTCLQSAALARKPQAAEAMLRAARLAMTLKDPRIAPISEHGLATNSAFVACEFVHGVSLQELADHLSSYTSPRALPPSVWGAVLASIGAEIAAGLAAAHGASTRAVHGGLSPVNVMISPQGAIKLLDFGLLAAVASPLEMTLLAGRAALVAPELRQPQPEGSAMDPSVDLYSLGAMLDALAAIELPAPPPGIAVFPATRPMSAKLRPLLKRLMDAAPEKRTTAADAEAAFRHIVRDLRGIDVGVEVGTLVRLIMQLRPAPVGGPMPAPATMARVGFTGALPAAVVTGSHRPPVVATPTPTIDEQPFTDEPTAILDVAGSGKPSALAAILLELRAADEEEASNTSSAVAEAALEMPDSAATRLASVPLTMLAASAPSRPFAVPSFPAERSTERSPEAPPSPDEAFMDLDLVDRSGAVSVSAPALAAAAPESAPKTPPPAMAAPVPSPPDAYAHLGVIAPGHEQSDESVAAQPPESSLQAGETYGQPAPSPDSALAVPGAARLSGPTASNQPAPPQPPSAAAAQAFVPAFATLAIPGVTDEEAGEVDATIVSTEAPPLEMLLAPSNDASPLLPMFGDSALIAVGPPQGNGAPVNELAGLTSGEISASLANPSHFPPSAGAPMPAPANPAAAARSSAGVPRPAASPEAIAFADFSMAVSVDPKKKRANETPANWRPGGDLDGPAKAASAQPRAATARSAGAGPSKRVLTIAITAVAVASAVAIALLAS